MERIIKEPIVAYLTKNSLLNCMPHGFMSQKSTITNVLESTLDWVADLDNNIKVDTIYIDFSRI